MQKETPGTYNWEGHRGHDNPIRAPRPRVEIDDETWRDGLQGTQTKTHPSIIKREEYLLAAAREGYIDHADIGFPGSSSAHKRHLVMMIEFVERKNLGISLSVAGRGAASPDIRAIFEVAEKSGHILEADLFLDVSEIRAKFQGWDRSAMIAKLRENISLLVDNGLPVMFVPERSTSSSPQELYEVCKMAVDLGVNRICVADTQGKATPRAISNILRWFFEEIGDKYPDLKFDFHEHNDLGMALANCLVAAEEGVDRLHATARGIGERAGNANLEQLVVLLNIEGYRGESNTQEIRKFTKMAAEILHRPVSSHEPLVSDHWPETSSGSHASAYGKDGNNLYLPFNPEMVGLDAEVRIGTLSGKANVVGFCNQIGISDVTSEEKRKILDYAGKHLGLLTERKVRQLLGRES